MPRQLPQGITSAARGGAARSAEVKRSFDRLRQFRTGACGDAVHARGGTPRHRARYTSIRTGLSISALNAASNSAPSAPSTTR